MKILVSGTYYVSIIVGLPGSKILVTTLNSVVSSIVVTIDPHYLQPLSDEDCWDLIAQRALSNRNLDGKEKLVAIGEKIAEKCEAHRWQPKQ